MKVYIDLLILINFIYDFMILMSVSILLKRHIVIKNIIIGSLIGLSTIVSIILPLSKVSIVLLKIITSMVMVLFSFGVSKFLENLFYFYVITIIIGGSQYLVSNSKVNLILMLIFTPFILYLYIKSHKKYKLNIPKYHSVILIDKDNAYNLKGYMDTGNNLVCPLTSKPVILLSPTIKIIGNNTFYVPYKVLNSKSILKCVSCDKVLIDGREVNCLIGLSDNQLMNGVDVILNERMRVC